jgi:N4-gp56 family major capsid protein
MVTIGTTGHQVENAVEMFFDRALLLRAVPQLIFSLFGRRGMLMPNMGNIVRWVRVEALAPATTPLVEGVNPPGQNWDKTNIDAELEEYGDFTETSSLKQLTEQDVVLNSMADAFGEQMGVTVDLVVRDKISGGSSVLYQNLVATRADVADTVGYADLDRMLMQLATGLARPVTEFVGSSPDAVAEPIMPCYPCIVHPHLVPAIEAIGASGAGFVPVRRYAANTQLLPGEFGSYGALRFCSTTLATILPSAGDTINPAVYRSTNGTEGDIYQIIALGREAYGVAPLENSVNVGMIIKTPEQVGGALNRYASVGWVAVFAAKILNDAFLCRLEVLAKK